MGFLYILVGLPENEVKSQCLLYHLLTIQPEPGGHQNLGHPHFGKTQLEIRLQLQELLITSWP